MTVSTGTRRTIFREAFGLLSALGALLWEHISFVGWDCFTVNKRVAGNAQGLPVVDIKQKFRVVGNRLYVMGVYCYSASAATLAGVIVPLIDFISPFFDTASSKGAEIGKRLTALPVWRPVPFSRTSRAAMGAELGVSMGAFEGFPAKGTSKRDKWVHGKVLALAGAKLSTPKEPKGLDGKRLPALLTDNCVHGSILPQLSFIRVNVPQLERMATAFPHLDIRRLDA
jgi:hypothetical protein